MDAPKPSFKNHFLPVKELEIALLFSFFLPHLVVLGLEWTIAAQLVGLCLSATTNALTQNECSCFVFAWSMHR